MLIGLCGAICAGKKSIADYLINQHGFKRIHLARPGNTPPAKDEQNEAQDLFFPDETALLDFVTLRWRDRWLTTDVWDHSVLDALLRRPFFLMVSVEAPVHIRWQRFRNRSVAQGLSPPTLEQFVLQSDSHLFNPTTGLGALFERAQLKVLNSSISIPSLHAALDELNLLDNARMRPDWDQYFMQLAHLAARRSNCMKRAVGCVIVRENRVISTGYNGTPRGVKNCNEGGCPRCNAASRAGVSLSTCLCLHAEENALLEAGCDRIGKHAVLYCSTCPCLTCSVKITQVGIKEVIYSEEYIVDNKTEQIFALSGVRLRQFTPTREGLVDLSSGRVGFTPIE